MIKVVKVAILFTFFIPFFLTTKVVSASEGKAELGSLTNDDFRCSIYSILTQQRKYKVLVSCRDLIYPSDATVFAYVLWADPIQEGAIIKMGQLQFGKKVFDVGRAFTRAFVTKEPNPGVKTPQGPVVMQGFVRPDLFLDSPVSLTPTQVPTTIQPQTPEEEANGVEKEKPPSTKDKVSSGLKTAGTIISIVMLVGAVAGLILMKRSKGR